MPGGMVFPVLVGIVLLLISGALLSGRYARPAGLLLIVLLVVWVVLFDLTGLLTGDKIAIESLLKDIALIGAAYAFTPVAKENDEGE